MTGVDCHVVVSWCGGHARVPSPVSHGTGRRLMLPAILKRQSDQGEAAMGNEPLLKHVEVHSLLSGTYDHLCKHTSLADRSDFSSPFFFARHAISSKEGSNKMRIARSS